METEMLGFAAATLTTGAFVPQAVKTIKSRNTSDISLAMYVIFTIGIVLWLLYGLRIGSVPMICANTVSLGLAATILGLKLRYG
jgi:MtN3 and saliva related transmembrane protein